MLNSRVYGISVVLGVQRGRSVRVVVGIAINCAVENRLAGIIVGTAVGAVNRRLVGRQETHRAEIFAHF